jgi:hypothetical protein
MTAISERIETYYRHRGLTPLRLGQSCPDCGSREQVWTRHLDGTHDRYCSPCFWAAFRRFRYQQ